MKHLLWSLVLLALATAHAHARCTGDDLFAELEREEPATAARLLAEARAVPNGEGRLWRIEKPGVTPSHILGTFHVADAVEKVPGAAWDALDTARVAVFEVTLDDEAALKERLSKDPAFVLDPGAKPFAERMSPDDLALVQQAFRERGVPPAVAERLSPWMQMSLVTFPPCQIQAVQEGAQMLDVVLARRAVGRGVPEVGLEDAVTALESLSKLREDDITRLIVSAGRSGDIDEDLFVTNLQLYADGRIALIDVLNDWLARRYMPDLGLDQVNARMKEQLLDARNEQWLPTLLEEVGRGRAFVAVGALHLVGENGLIAALERAGYTTTRLD